MTVVLFLEPKFPLGKLVCTPGIKAQVLLAEVAQALERHSQGDWGDCAPKDQRANDLALENGSRLFSVYHTANGTKFWIITEADRASTCVLLPSEY